MNKDDYNHVTIE